jgi:hypothetical protein
MMQIGKKFLAICRKYNIKQTTTEPHQEPHQNNHTKTESCSRCMDRTGCPEQVCQTHGWKTPIEVAFGDTPDFSNLLQFEFWELVYYHNPCQDAAFPKTKEELL